MRLVIIRIITLLLTFTVGVSIVAGLRILFHSPPTNTAKLTESITPSPPNENILKVQFSSISCGPDGSTRQTEFETSNGETLSYSTYPFNSSTHANKELRTSLKDALRIIERAPKLDWNKRKVGERIVAVFPPSENGKQQVGILWTNKSILRIVKASTLELAFEYEQKEARWD